jgi:Protein of unknown function (DUF3037)
MTKDSFGHKADLPLFGDKTMTTQASKGYYSIIQYCPDLGRLEAANIGVLLFCPEKHFLKAITTPNNSRIIRFFGSEGRDWIRINEFKKGLEDRIAIEALSINTLDDLQRFIDSRANLLQITPPRPMRVNEPNKDLEDLFTELVGEPAHRPSSHSQDTKPGITQPCPKQVNS